MTDIEKLIEQVEHGKNSKARRLAHRAAKRLLAEKLGLAKNRRERRAVYNLEDKLETAWTFPAISPRCRERRRIRMIYRKIREEMF